MESFGSQLPIKAFCIPDNLRVLNLEFSKNTVIFKVFFKADIVINPFGVSINNREGDTKNSGNIPEGRFSVHITGSAYKADIFIPVTVTDILNDPVPVFPGKVQIKTNKAPVRRIITSRLDSLSKLEYIDA